MKMLITHWRGYTNPTTGKTEIFKPAQCSHKSGSVVKRFDGREYVVRDGTLIRI